MRHMDALETNIRPEGKRIDARSLLSSSRDDSLQRCSLRAPSPEVTRPGPIAFESTVNAKSVGVNRQRKEIM